MNDKQPGFWKADFREAVYMIGFACLGALAMSPFSTEPTTLIAAGVIGMTLGKLLARTLPRRPEQE